MRKVCFLSYSGTIIKTLYVNANTYAGAIELAILKLKDTKTYINYEYIMVSTHEYDSDGKISNIDISDVNFHYQE